MMLARGGAAASSKRLLSSTRTAFLLPSHATATAPRMLEQRNSLPLTALAANATNMSRRALASMPHNNYQFSTSKSNHPSRRLPFPPPFLTPPSSPTLPRSTSYHPFSFIIKQTVYEDVWPMGSTNTILNVCPQGERFVVERFGKLLDIKESGWFLGA